MDLRRKKRDGLSSDRTPHKDNKRIKRDGIGSTTPVKSVSVNGVTQPVKMLCMDNSFMSNQEVRRKSASATKRRKSWKKATGQGGEDISDADLLKLFSEDFTPKKPGPSSSSTPACNNKEAPRSTRKYSNHHESFNEPDSLLDNLNIAEFEANVEGSNSPPLTPGQSVEKDVVSDSEKSDIWDMEAAPHENNMIFLSELDITVAKDPESVENNVIKKAEEVKTSVKKTPGSLKDRIKSALCKNAQTPNRSPAVENALRKQEKLKQALQTAKEIQDEGSEFDIGPFYGLPSKVKDLFASQRGISKFYDWQDECLRLPAVKQMKNLIYSLPTSGGKTLVAEILIIKALLCYKKDAIFILPFVSIVQEKVRNLSAFALDLDFQLEEYASSKGQIPPKLRRKRQSLYVCTIEKASTLTNSLIEMGRMDRVGLVVVDELHMLGEGGSRGATLETTLAKIKHTSNGTQIVGMSATLNNIQDLCQFLNADIYSNDFRPVHLQEYVKMGDTLYEVHSRAPTPDEQIKYSRSLTFQQDATRKQSDPDQVTDLVSEVIPHHSCLVFCPTKKNCENVAQLICKLSMKTMKEIKHKEKKGLLYALKQAGNNRVCDVLRATIPYGVAYHHSGLTMDERKLIEEAYSEGTLCLLCCTSTLAAGVNLPAKRVILRAPYVGNNFLSHSQYKQMVGRAGRAGLDSSGESILILKDKDKIKFMQMLEGPKDVCHSSLLYEGGKGLRKLMLSVIGLQITPDLESIKKFLEHTLCFGQQETLNCDLLGLTEEALSSLNKLDLIHLKKPKLEVSRIGKAAFKGGVDVDLSKRLYEDLCLARGSLSLSSYIHLLYIVTPYDILEQVKVNWMVFYDQMCKFNLGESKAMATIGISEDYVAKKASGITMRKGPDEVIIKRAYVTLMLYDLWNQKTIWDVSSKFHVPRGFIQSLLSASAAFASALSHFCQELDEMWAFHDLLPNFTKKLSYCCSQELLPLMEIPGVKIGRARQLYNAGYTTLKLLAFCDPESLVKGIEHMPRRTARQIVASAQVLRTQKVEALKEEIEEM